MRVLVCGGRTYSDRDKVNETLDNLLPDIDILIHGGAQGADSLAREWAKERLISSVAYMADWKNLGRAAGPRRNELMLREGKPDVVIAFPGGRGTAHMIAIAKAAGVRIVEVE